MNKETILDCYFHDLPKPNRLGELVTSFPKFFRSQPETPENLRAFTDNQFPSAQTSACDESLSFYSALSRVTIDQSLLDDIKLNPSSHSPFQTIDNHKDEPSRWFSRDDQWAITGPFSSSKMDQKFQSRELGARSQVKEAFDDDFLPLIYLLKRYARLKKETKIPEPQTRKRQISGKLFRFKKGKAPRRRTLAAIENYRVADLKGMQRGRTKTLAPTPFLKNQFEEVSDDTEDDFNFPPIRIRARTRI